MQNVKRVVARWLVIVMLTTTVAMPTSAKKATAPDKVLLTAKQIVAQNKANYKAGNHMTDLKNEQ